MRVARVAVYVVAPAAQARGIHVRPVCCLAPVGQPNAQTPEPTQPRTARKRWSPEYPSASVPRRTIRAFSPAIAAGTWATLISRSTRRKNGSSAWGVHPCRPCSVRHRASTWSGVRKHVAMFTRVVPPTARPSGSTMGGVPSVTVCPASR